MSRRQKILSWFLRGITAAILFFFSCLACLYVFLQRDPDELLAGYLSRISESTGLEFNIGSVDVTLLPLPAFALSDISIRGRGLVFTAAWAQAHPTLANILHGDLFPGFIRVTRPKLEYVTDLPLASLNELANEIKHRFSGQEVGGGELPYSLALEISQCEGTVAGRGSAAARLANLDASLRLYEDGDVSGEIHLSALRLVNGEDTRASLENFHLAGRTNIHSWRTDSHDLRAEGVASWRGVVRDARFGMKFGSAASGWHGRGSVRGYLEIAGEAIPFGLLGQATHLSSGDETVFRGVDWQLGADSGSLDLSLTIPEKMSDFVLNGTLLAHRLSLTQWLGFARNLAPGLQIALDNITNAKMKFTLDARRLSAWSISASCSGATFTGSGGVADWQKPVVTLDLASPAANLGLGLPESVGKAPDTPYFPHPPLTPMPGEPLKPGETGIGYDIRLAAKLLRYGPIKIRNASMRIHPGKLDDKLGLEDVLMDAQASIYGGSMKGACILGADKNLPMHITVKAEKVNGTAISQDMPVLPFRRGIWQGNATVTSSGRQLAAFLGNLRGAVAATGVNATLAATGNKMEFKRLGASVQLRSGEWNSRHLTMDGLWKGSVRDESMDVQTELNGRILFGGDGMGFRQLPGSITARIPAIPGDGNVKIAGKFSGQTGRNSFELLNGKLELLGIAIHGNAKLDGAKEHIYGKLRTEIADPRSLLAKAGFKDVKLPKILAPAKISADFTAARDIIKLVKIQAALGKLKAAGSLECDFKNKRPAFAVDLTLNRLHLADFLGRKPSQSTPDWDFRFLTAFDANGKLKIRELAGWNASLSNCQAPFTLEDGRILANGMSASFYGAAMTGSFNGDFRKGLDFDSIVRVNDFDLGAAAREQKLETRLTGRASMEMRLGAKLAGRDKLASALNGKWSFSVKNGSWQSVSKGKPGQITRFNVAEAFGNITAGIVKSGNFHLGGPGLEVTGNGSLSLPSQTIDCDFYVGMKNMPDFPLRLYGPLKDMKTSIGAGKMILNAVGDVTGGFVNAVGGILKGAWGIFSN